MAHISDFLSIIQHSEPQDINRMLGVLHTKLQTDVQLSSAVQYDVKPKRSQCADVAEKIRLYQGPDQESQEVLEANFARWSLQPGSFWKTSGGDRYLDLDPQAQIVHCYVRARGGDA
ncbi:hypothetical protein Q7P37_000283 [Cladosporium fusiforme]